MTQKLLHFIIFVCLGTKHMYACIHTQCIHISGWKCRRTYPLHLDFPKRAPAYELGSTVCPKKRSPFWFENILIWRNVNLEVPNRPNLTFWRFKCNWLHQNAHLKALILVSRTLIRNKQTFWGGVLCNLALDELRLQELSSTEFHKETPSLKLFKLSLCLLQDTVCTCKVIPAW